MGWIVMIVGLVATLMNPFIGATIFVLGALAVIMSGRESKANPKAPAAAGLLLLMVMIVIVILLLGISGVVGVVGGL